ncbi:hypothetical protein D3C76_603130 [compost metagenome]
MVVQGNSANVQRTLLVIDSRVALGQAAVETHAPLPLIPETAADVEVAAHLGVRAVAGGGTGQIFGERALGDDVDHAANATVRGNTVHQGPRPFEHFDPFGIFGEHAVIGCNAIHTIEGQLAQVAFTHREAANEKRVDDATRLPGGAHRGVSLQGIGHSHRLQVSQCFCGVAGDVEGRIHHVFVAKHA